MTFSRRASIDLLVLLCACARDEWLENQQSRCGAMGGGLGHYDKENGTFECWRHAPDHSRSAQR